LRLVGPLLSVEESVDEPVPEVEALELVLEAPVEEVEGPSSEEFAA